MKIITTIITVIDQDDQLRMKIISVLIKITMMITMIRIRCAVRSGGAASDMRCHGRRGEGALNPAQNHTVRY